MRKTKRRYWPAVGSLAHLFRRLVTEPEGRVLVTLVAISLAIGTVFYHFVEGWSVLDSLYFCVITLTTIGYGDFSPGTPLGKAFTIVYVLAGVGLLIALVDMIARLRVRTHLVDRAGDVEGRSGRR